jgi:glycosyltransferase 2 family protein
MPFGVQFRMDRKAIISLIVAIVLAAVLLYFALRGIDWSRLGAILKGARVEYMALAVLVNSINLWVRSLRWRVLLDGERRLPMSVVFWSNAVGYLGNNFLPARFGEVMRIAAVGFVSGVSKSFVLATAVIERVLDAGVLVLLTSLALLLVEGLPKDLRRASLIFSALSIAGILVMIVLPRFEHRVSGLVRSMPKLQHIASGFLNGLRCLHDLGRAIRFLALTLIIWPIDALIGVLVAQAISLDLELTTSMIVLAAMGLASAMPSTPGYLGVFQAVAVAVLGPFGVPAEMALAWVFLFQVQGYIGTAILGLTGLFVLQQKKPAPAAA